MPADLPGIRFELDEADASTRVKFVYSAAYETALSLQVLADPKRHAVQHRWVRRARRLPRELRRRLQAFRFAWVHGPPDFMLPSTIAADFPEELLRLRQLPAELVAFEFLRPFWDHAGRRDPELLRSGAVRERVGRRVEVYGGERTLALLLFEDPAELRELFLDLLEDYWVEAFRAEWERLEGELDGATREGREEIERGRLYPLLSTFSRRLIVDQNRNEFGINIPHHHRVPLTETNPLMLMPSAFVWPNVQVNCDGPFPLTLVYPAPFIARSARPNLPDPQLTRQLRALGDDTRLRALRLIAQAPRSTQELASLIPISEAGLSKHLRILSEAGLVESRRAGYYVLYTISEKAVDRLSNDLREFLRS